VTVSSDRKRLLQRFGKGAAVAIDSHGTDFIAVVGRLGAGRTGNLLQSKRGDLGDDVVESSARPADGVATPV